MNAKPLLHQYLSRLLILLLGILLPVLLVGEIAEEVLAHERFAFEQPLMLWLHHHIPAAFLALAVLLHWLGSFTFAAMLSGLLALWQYAHKRVGYALFTVLGVALSALIMAIAKRFFNRPRPEFWPHLVVESNASFPSGHSTFAAALATIIIITFRYSRHRAWVVAAMVGFALLMGLSRVILGVHYPTDVLVGWMTGVSSVLGLYVIMFAKLKK